jgi:hypothetical protein
VGQNHRLASSLVRVQEDTSSNPLCGPSARLLKVIDQTGLKYTERKPFTCIGHLLLGVTHNSVSSVCKSRSDPYPYTSESTDRFYGNCCAQLLPTLSFHQSAIGVL